LDILVIRVVFEGALRSPVSSVSLNEGRYCHCVY